MWYHYRQNNTGGNFEVDDRVAVNVYVEAVSAERADAIAQTEGVYFDGCSSGRDCSCCGDRWSAISEYGGSGAEQIESPWHWKHHEAAGSGPMNARGRGANSHSMTLPARPSPTTPTAARRTASRRSWKWRCNRDPQRDAGGGGATGRDARGSAAGGAVYVGRWGDGILATAHGACSDPGGSSGRHAGADRYQRLRRRSPDRPPDHGMGAVWRVGADNGRRVDQAVPLRHLRDSPGGGLVTAPTPRPTRAPRTRRVRLARREVGDDE